MGRKKKSTKTYIEEAISGEVATKKTTTKRKSTKSKISAKKAKFLKKVTELEKNDPAVAAALKKLVDKKIK